MLDILELVLAAWGAVSLLGGAFYLGRWSERRSRHRPRPRKTAEILQFQTAGEAGMALAAEINKGRKANPELVQRIGKIQNDLRRTAG